MQIGVQQALNFMFIKLQTEINESYSFFHKMETYF